MTALEKKIIVTNPRGVHGRVATRLALIAEQYGVRLCIVNDAEGIDCTSVLDVLSMAYVSGSSLTIRATGEKKKARKALAAVEKVLSGRETDYGQKR